MLCHHILKVEDLAAQLFVLLLCVSFWPSLAEDIGPVPAVTVRRAW